MKKLIEISKGNSSISTTESKIKFIINSGNDEKFSFHKISQAVYICFAFAKSKAEPENSNNLLVANDSTPLIRAFFVRSLRTPKERLIKKACSSMVAYNGKGSALCCVPYVAVSQPVIRYRPIKPENFQAVISKILRMEIPTMIYKFIILGTRLYIATYAKSEEQARQYLNLTNNPNAVYFARIKGGTYA